MLGLQHFVARNQSHIVLLAPLFIELGDAQPLGFMQRQ
jgi:hypothetical protein